MKQQHIAGGMMYRTQEELEAAFPAHYAREEAEKLAGLWAHGGIEFEG